MNVWLQSVLAHAKVDEHECLVTVSTCPCQSGLTGVFGYIQNLPVPKWMNMSILLHSELLYAKVGEQECLITVRNCPCLFLPLPKWMNMGIWFQVTFVHNIV